MKSPEFDFQKQVVQLAHIHGWRVAHFGPAMVNGRWMTPVQGDAKGFPDLVLVKGKKLIFVELKAGINEMSDEQINWMADLWATGADCRLWTPNSWEQIKETLEAPYG